MCNIVRGLQLCATLLYILRLHLIISPGYSCQDICGYCKMLLNIRCCWCDRWCHLVNKEFYWTAPFTVRAFTMFTGWTDRNSTKISGSFFLSHIKYNHSISWSDPYKINLPLKSLANQVYLQSKLGDSTASYIFAKK